MRADRVAPGLAVICNRVAAGVNRGIGISLRQEFLRLSDSPGRGARSERFLDGNRGQQPVGAIQPGNEAPPAAALAAPARTLGLAEWVLEGIKRCIFNSLLRMYHEGHRSISFAGHCGSASAD